MRPYSQQHASLVATLSLSVGPRHVLTGANATRRYSRGYRFGSGEVVAVVRPGTLSQLWQVARDCAAAGVIIIPQAANTGLTGGSTPHGDYDRAVVLVSLRRLRRVYLLEGGRQVLCLPGATLFDLEKLLRPLGREPHSVIGSSCLGASVVGGVCNNSGGSLVRRGPAFTQLALFAQADAGGQLALVNHLGIDLGNGAETMLDRLDRGAFDRDDLPDPSGRCASDTAYALHVRDIDAETPARYNADPRRLFEASGCAGHLLVFAVRLDTFPRADGERVFYIGTNDADRLAELRRRILACDRPLPISAEYIHRDAFDIAEQYGKDMFLAIRLLGTDRLPMLFRAKAWFDDLTMRLGARPGLSERLLQWLSGFLPRHLPARMMAWRDRFEHHLLLKVDAVEAAETHDFLSDFFGDGSGACFECTPEEGAKAFLHRFVVAGAAVRYRAVHAAEVEDIVALDVALRRNDPRWEETLPPAIDQAILHKLYYGHFLCHVFHQDYIVRKGSDPEALEHAMWALLDQRGAQYPAEHNVGHLYHARPELADFYRTIDPANMFNPGVGRTSRSEGWS